MMTTHFFTGKGQSSPTARLRGYLIVEHLRKSGMSVVMHEPPARRASLVIDASRYQEFVKHFKILKAIGNNDPIYLVRTVFQLDFVLLIMFFRIFFRRKVIFDFDDAIYLKDFCHYRSRWLTRFSSAVVVGNEYLRKWAVIRNPRVYVIPTAIPFDVYQQYTRTTRPASSPLLIGWSGHAKNHVKNLQLLVPVFRELLLKKISFKFILIGGMKYEPMRELFADLKELDITIIDSIEWNDPKNIARLIQTFDIGVMPLVKDSKTEGKCALKAIEYMACSVPAIVSPVGANISLIENGIDGWQAETTEDWVSIIINIVNNPSLLSEIGGMAQKKVKDNYSYDAIIPHMKQVIESI
jgi:glycosyltransferase involved in cell wall biosynthesis